jgi:hypothetical protein
MGSVGELTEFVATLIFTLVILAVTGSKSTRPWPA